MNVPDFFDFVLDGGWDLLFPEEENRSYECPFCEEVINGNSQVEWVDKEGKIFKCPNCDGNVLLKT